MSFDSPVPSDSRCPITWERFLFRKYSEKVSSQIHALNAVISFSVPLTTMMCQIKKPRQRKTRRAYLGVSLLAVHNTFFLFLCAVSTQRQLSIDGMVLIQLVKILNFWNTQDHGCRVKSRTAYFLIVNGRMSSVSSDLDWYCTFILVGVAHTTEQLITIEKQPSSRREDS